MMKKKTPPLEKVTGQKGEGMLLSEIQKKDTESLEKIHQCHLEEAERLLSEIERLEAQIKAKKSARQAHNKEATYINLELRRRHDKELQQK